MTAGIWAGRDSVVESYLGRQGLFGPGGEGRADHWDEMTGANGALLPGWAEVAGAMDGIGRAGLPALTALVDRLLEDDGVTYTPISPKVRPAAVPEGHRRWRLDPVPVLMDGGEFAQLEAGVIQRSLLLDALLTDLYGPRKVLTRGLIPPELVFEHPHYLRQAQGITIPGAHQLFFHAVDLCRGPDGAFLVLGDRAQAPSGAGYAMADRRVVSRVLPELFRRSAPRGLSTFFHSVRGALQAIAPNAAEDPRVVVLSPGTHSETAFDQAFLASLLGLPLVESADLTVRGGRLLMRGLGRYEPVDVVLRRVDASWSDPLELRPESHLGVVGLTEACRRGTVTVVNSLGSGVVENPGLLPFLPALCQALLGEPLKLQSVQTFWCGNPDDRDSVLTGLLDMVIRPTAPGTSIVPAHLPAAELDELRRRIRAEPTRWVGQHRVAFSETPAVGPAGLDARRMGMRIFSVAHQSGYVVMPGALGRLVNDESDSLDSELGLDDLLAPNGAVDALAFDASGQHARPSADSLAKDIWVRSIRVDSAADTARGPEAELYLDSGPLVEPIEMAAAASPRVLEDMYWLGRYAERTEDLTRLLITARGLADTFRFRPEDVAAGSVVVLLDAVAAVSGAFPAFGIAADPMARMRQLMLDGAHPGTVAQSLAGLHGTARSVRDQLSGDTWMVLAAIDRAVAELAANPDDDGSILQAAHTATLSGMLALSGLASENMVRDPGWYLMDIGRRLERAQQLTALLRATLTTVHSNAVESIVIESVLAAAESGLTYRRRYRGRTQVGTVLELLLLDAGNPRSLAYQINALSDGLRRLPNSSGATRPERMAEELAAVLRRSRTMEMDDVDQSGHRPELARLLKEVYDLLRAIADAVAAQHFWRSRPMLTLGGAVYGSDSAAVTV